MQPIKHRIVLWAIATALAVFVAGAAIAEPPEKPDVAPTEQATLDTFDTIEEFAEAYLVADPARQTHLEKVYWYGIQRETDEAQATLPYRVTNQILLVGMSYDGDKTTFFDAMVPVTTIDLETANRLGGALHNATCEDMPTSLLFKIFEGISVYRYFDPNGRQLLQIEVRGVDCGDGI